MADEAVLKVETHIPVNFTCSTSVTIEKGAICKMASPMTAVLSDGANDIVALITNFTQPPSPPRARTLIARLSFIVHPLPY